MACEQTSSLSRRRAAASAWSRTAAGPARSSWSPTASGSPRGAPSGALRCSTTTASSPSRVRT
eukprot:4881037-Pyramimonas_sp.AAC.1